MSRAASWSDIAPAPARLKPLHALLTGAPGDALLAQSTLRWASRSRETAARHVIAGRSLTRASNRGAGLSPSPVDGTPGGSDLQRFSSARGGVPGARTIPPPPA
ncbi:hypothetical protein NDU88_002760 [Pleurodeles waltl]|uniref:Uncharacterized protein n=1 Tax=Pleurodeles waltl TaxID=8319 RepID=A0AAV7PAY2_PLEWA|nr:hypothetical protein NDU88_002760 [Pleurodeles waltl]